MKAGIARGRRKNSYYTSDQELEKEKYMELTVKTLVAWCLGNVN